MFFLKRAAYFVYDHWRIFAIGLAVLIIVGFLMSYCRKAAPHLNEVEIQKAQVAVQQHNDEKLKEVLAAADAREQGIDANVARSDANTKAAVEAAKTKYDNMNAADLQAEYERRV